MQILNIIRHRIGTQWTASRRDVEKRADRITSIANYCDLHRNVLLLGYREFFIYNLTRIVFKALKVMGVIVTVSVNKMLRWLHRYMSY